MMDWSVDMTARRTSQDCIIESECAEWFTIMVRKLVNVIEYRKVAHGTYYTAFTPCSNTSRAFCKATRHRAIDMRT